MAPETAAFEPKYRVLPSAIIRALSTIIRLRPRNEQKSDSAPIMGQLNGSEMCECKFFGKRNRGCMCTARLGLIKVSWSVGIKLTQRLLHGQARARPWLRL